MRITKKIREQLRRDWVKALRSGKYKQTTGVLSNGEAYCCLGVACEVYREKFPLKREVRPPHVEGERNAIAYGGNESILPPVVSRAFGLFDDEGTYGDGGVSLTYLNDAGKKFTAIAKVIESRPPGLFVDDDKRKAVPSAAK